MTPLGRLTDADQLTGAPARPPGELLLIFKHSTTCPISAAARSEVQAYLNAAGDAPAAVEVLVIEQRPLSNQIADRFQIRHESPQAILVRDGQAVWHASHRAITREALSRAVADHRSA